MLILIVIHIDKPHLEKRAFTLTFWHFRTQDTDPCARKASHACAHQDGHKESAAAHPGAGQGAQGAQGAKEASSQQSQSSLSRAGRAG